jgi:hypothetical protein
MAQTREKPTFVVRAPDPHNPGRWLTLGAAWEKKLEGGATGYSVKLNTVPVGSGWDGTLMLLPPLARADEAETTS